MLRYILNNIFNPWNYLVGQEVYATNGFFETRFLQGVQQGWLGFPLQTYEKNLESHMNLLAWLKSYLKVFQLASWLMSKPLGIFPLKGGYTTGAH
jgi:hypothetical protein